jgi:hypothetical protein
MSDDKDAHGMYQAQTSELADLQIQIRRVVDQCAKVIGDKAHAIPFGMAVSETIAELRNSVEFYKAIVTATRFAPPSPDEVSDA